MKIATRFAGCVYLLIAINVSFSNGDKLSVFPNPKTEVSEEAAFEKLLNLESKMQSGIQSLIKSAIPMVVRQGSEVDLSEGCMASLLKTLLALKDMKLWAVQMLDATGKPGSGMLLGTAGIMGSYHQCLNINIPDGYRNKNSNEPPQTGQYCIISLRTPLPPRSKKLKWFNPLFNEVNATFKTEAMNELLKYMWSMYDTPLKLGVCVPSACSEDDMRQLLEAGVSKIGIDAELKECQLPEKSEMDTVQRSILFIPTVLVITGVGFLFPFLGSGPDYKSMADDIVDLCQRKWWYNLLFISNYLPITGSCLGHLWYLSADLQLFLYAMIYFLLLFRKPKFGQIFSCLGMFAGVFSSGIITYIYEYPPAALADGANTSKNFEYANNVYTKPHVHLVNYSIGLFLGTYLARNKDTNVTRFQALIGWTIAIALGMTAVYGVYPWIISGKYTMLEAVTFSASQRLIWGIALAWLTYACFVGKAGYVNDFLSWPGFKPLVKLSFQLYVIHIVVQVNYWYTRLGNMEVTHSTLVFSFFGILCISHILSLAMRLFVEAPGIEVERVFFSWLFGGSKKRDENEKTELQLEEKYLPKDVTNDKMGEENGRFRL